MPRPFEGATDYVIQFSPTGDTGLGQWIGAVALCRSSLTLQAGVFLWSDGNEVIYSVVTEVPSLVGSGSTFSAALADWQVEAQEAFDRAKLLVGPLGPRTLQDVLCLRAWFGGN